MQKLFISLFVLFNMNYAMWEPITLPCAQILKQRLCYKGLGHFAEITYIDTQLGGELIHPQSILLLLELYAGQHSIEAEYEQNKYDIIQCIFQDWPGAIKRLKEFEMHQIVSKSILQPKS